MKNSIRLLMICICVAILLSSCKDYRSEHYGTNESTPEEASSALEYIKTKPQYSAFCEKIKGSELEKILSRPTAYTLFIPTNEAIQTKNLTDEKWTDVLSYHVCNSYYPASQLENISRIQTILSAVDVYEGKRIGVKDYKFLTVSRTRSDISVNGIAVGDQKIFSGGVVYSINQIIEPLPSVWEYLAQKSNDYTKIFSLYKSAESIEPDKDNSIKIGFDEFGNDVYDYVYTITNSEFDVVGRLNSEQQTFTCGLFTDAEFAKATAVVPTFDDLPDNVKNKILQDAVRRYSFTGLYSQLPFQADNCIGDRVDMKADMFDSSEDLSNGKVYNFAEGKLKIDFDKYFSPTTIEVDELGQFTSISNNTWTTFDGFIGGAVATPQGNVEHQLADGRRVTARRLYHITNNSANRIPFGIYINGADILPVPYTIRWKIIKIGERLDKYNYIKIREFAVNAANPTVQYSLVNAADQRAHAKAFSVRVLNAKKEVLGSYNTIINSAELKDENVAIPVPIKTIRANDDQLYQKIKSCEELYIEYDWSFDANRYLSNRVYLGFAVELNTKSVAGDEIYVDVDNVELIPNVK